jgi:hypothetical protein
LPLLVLSGIELSPCRGWRNDTKAGSAAHLGVRVEDLSIRSQTSALA